MAQHQPWSADNWQWDSRNLVATARPHVDKTSSRDKATEQGGEASTSSSPSTSGDQPSRSNGKSKGAAVCQVDGCNTDLGSLKEYHNRYKICEFHLKIPCIIWEGMQQRFCQQCGRFHNISEFDGDKRSCRARLQRHNARRRKNAEPAKVVKRPSSSSRQVLNSSVPGPSRSNSPASDDVKAAVSGSSQGARSHCDPHHQPFPQAEVQSQAPGPPSAWPNCVMNTTAALDNAFADFLKQENAHRGMSSTNTLPAFAMDGTQPPQQMFMEDLLGDSHSGLQNPIPSSDAMDMQYLSDLLSTPSDLAYKYSQQPDPSATQPSPQDGNMGMTPMYLLHRQELMAARQQGYVQGLQQQQQQQQLQLPPASWCRPPDMDLHSMDMDLEEGSMRAPTPPEPGCQGRLMLPHPDQQPSLQPQVTSADSLYQSSPPLAAPVADDHARQPSPIMETARDLLSFNLSQPKYIPEEHFTRMSAKLFNCTPEHLPGDLKQNLVGLLSCGVDHIEGYIAPGCLQLTVDAFLGDQQLAAMQDLSARQATECLLRSRNKALWGSDAMLLQWKDELVLVKNGKVEHVVSREGSRGLLPEIHSMIPACVSSTQMKNVKVTGSNIAGHGQTVSCRSQGAYLPVEVTQLEGTNGANHGQQLMLQLPSGLGRGSVQVEIARGGFISQAVPVLVLENEEAVAEIMQLKTMPIAGVEADAVLRDIGRVLEYSNNKQATVGNQAAVSENGMDGRCIAVTAKRLLSFACQVGWSGVSELLLPIASAMEATASGLVAELENLADGGLTLLHQAVRSRNVDLVSLLLTWGINNGHVWDYSAAGPAGLTILHLAALLNDGGKVADELTDVFADALTGWDSLEAEDGSTAADLAEQSGAQGINAMIQRKLAGQPSGIRLQQFDFDPDTGEWIEQDNSDSGSGELQTTKDWQPANGRLEESAALVVPASPHNATQLTPDEAISRRGVPRHLKVEAANSLLAMSSPSSSGAEDVAEVLTMGLRQRSKEQPHSSGVYSGNDPVYLKHRKRDVPSVFDAQAAMLSSAVVGVVGVCALGLRFCFERWCQI